ncbi:hypothetical protein EUGRSUZ_B01937 [Eucalyptus grandis]|uniref:Uncharacterized protein n=2 Tax=Eucalyptus grandis TaxID=71139 RepID=A0ACC3LT89_EUCGR|nr:hypothetical protein EUGRSUZ_B01937 [Eucalyptus grandis]
MTPSVSLGLSICMVRSLSILNSETSRFISGGDVGFGMIKKTCQKQQQHHLLASLIYGTERHDPRYN